MIFKSFNQFITESNSASLVPVNEGFFQQDVVFKLKKRTADEDGGERAKLSMIAKFNPPNGTPESAAIELVRQMAQDKLANDALFKVSTEGNIVFITIDKNRQRWMINDQAILTAVLSFRNSDNFDMSKAASLNLKPFMIAGDIQIWEDKDMAALSKLNVTNPIKPQENQEIINVTHEENQQTDQTPIKLPTADSDVLAFLKEKLLGDAGKVVESVNGTVALAKSGIKSREVKFAQLILLAPEFSKELPNIKLASTLGSADGSYGPKTAAAYGLLLDGKSDTSRNSLEVADVEKLAQYCTLVKLTKPRLQQIWDASELKTGGGGGGGDKSDTSGKDGSFTFVNKP
jgi:hypothetical protein